MDYDRSPFEVGSLSLFLRFNRIRRPRTDRHHESATAQAAYVTHPGPSIGPFYLYSVFELQPCKIAMRW